MRLGVLCLGISLLLVSPCWSGEEAPSNRLTFTVTKKRVVFSSKKGTTKIYVSGTTKGLPPQIKLAIILSYNFWEVPGGRSLATIGSDGSFNEVLLEPTVPLIPDTGYELGAASRIGCRAGAIRN